MPSVAPQESDDHQVAVHNLTVRFAASKEEILDAKKLRYRVFAEEMGAKLHVEVPGVDEDHYDPFCQHLIVWDEDLKKVAGTYRVLTPEAAIKAGDYYSAGEFDLSPLKALREGIVEVGRSCIDARYRSGAVITMLWGGLTRFMRDNQYKYLMGCSSIGLGDGGHNAANVYNSLRQKNIVDQSLQVKPLNPIPNIEQMMSAESVEIPPLLKGYLRVGAKICGEPSVDPDFNTADVLLLLSMEQVSLRYVKHFFRE